MTHAHAVLALLLLGHALADFVLQTRWMIEEKPRSPKALCAHAGVVLGAQAACVLWYSASGQAALLVIAIALSHLLIDRGRCVLDRRWPARSPFWFGLDQAAHVGALAVAWLAWPAGRGIDADPDAVARAGFALAIYAFNVNGGSAIVAALLRSLRVLSRGAPAAAADREEAGGAGRLIGILERLLVATMICVGQWGAVGLVLAAKSVARFKRLDDQEFAELYLVGTMGSMAVAVLSGLGLQAIL